MKPTTENALKFELFVFDALPLAERWLVVETPREEEFAPAEERGRGRLARNGEAGDRRTWPGGGWSRRA